MKKSTRNTVLLSLLMLVCASMLLAVLLNNIGAQIDELVIENQPSMVLSMQNMPEIVQEDYELYPLHPQSLKFDTDLASYYITSKDAAVLGAKQVEALSGSSLKGKTILMELFLPESNERYWAGHILNSADETYSQSGSFFVDAVSGRLMALQLYNDIKENVVEYTQEDIDECQKRAIEVAARYYPQYANDITILLEKEGPATLIYTLAIPTMSDMTVAFTDEDKHIFIFSLKAGY